MITHREASPVPPSMTNPLSLQLLSTTIVPISQTRKLRHREHESFLPYSKWQRQDLNLGHLALWGSFFGKSHWLCVFGSTTPCLCPDDQPLSPHPLHLLMAECETTELSPHQWLMSGHLPVHNPERSESCLLPFMSPSIPGFYIFLCLYICCVPCCVPTQSNCSLSGNYTQKKPKKTTHILWFK